ncbi:MAG: hypothetical protein JRG89_16625 [Deltaproteobacteria bacterium]|nr:hypothetical protein [Deltaproteobacteria bacterium]MBW2722826.1 hypothetical protein [Deltaproteobacteria bacterium]
MKRTLGILALAIELIAHGGSAWGASFEGLGMLPGGDFSRAWAMSDDGRVVVGAANSLAGGEAFRWTAATGMVSIGDLAGGAVNSSAYDVTPNGRVIVGSGETASGFLGFRWEDGVMVALSELPGGAVNSGAWSVSADGAFIGGKSTSGAGIELVRWVGTTIEGLGFLPGGGAFGSGGAISDDGTVVVGCTVSSNNVSPPFDSCEAARWTQGGGLVGLGDLPGGGFTSTLPALSGDGLVAAGTGAPTLPTAYEATRWTSGGGLVGIGHLPGHSASFARAISRDGNVIAGKGQGSISQPIFVWDSGNGMRELHGLLVADGIDLTGWTLVDAYGLNGDGTVIVGGGSNPQGDYEAFRAVIVDCGDGDIDPGEQCDDGNRGDGDCCSSTCQFEPASGACDSGDACTSGETCDGGGICGNGSGTNCDDGLFCSGPETCDPVFLCQPGIPPVVDDGVGCTLDSCDEGNDLVLHIPNHASCDNNVFCDGTETCDVIFDCLTGSGDPCVGIPATPLCEESLDICVECFSGGDCDDLDPCTLDACVSSACTNDPDPADDDGDGVCDVIDNCPHVANGSQTNGDSFPAGDACQCGDVDDSGVIDAVDVQRAREFIVSRTPSGSFVVERCNVVGPNDGGLSDCTVADVALLDRAAQGGAPVLGDVCEAYDPPP